MSAYRCLVLSPQGRRDWRTIDAASEREAVSHLIAEGFTPLEVRTGAESLSERLNRPLRLGFKLRLGDQTLLLTQLAMLVRSGLPVDRSLDLLREQATRAAPRGVLTQTLSAVRGGSGLGDALETQDAFPRFVIGVVRAAERGGGLGAALTSVAERLAVSSATRRQLITSLTYPAAVLAATFLALTLVITVVVPQFEPIFAGQEDKLPTLTVMVLRVSAAVTGHPLLLVLGFIVPILLLFLLARAPFGRALLAQHRSRIPLLGLRNQYLAGQFMGVLGTLLVNRVVLTAALPLARESLGSRHWRDELERVEQRVREGSRFSAALAVESSLPATAIRLLEVGEKTGELASTALQASAIVGEAARARIDRIVSLANPIAIISLGGLVAMLVSGVMLGIFAIGDFAG